MPRLPPHASTLRDTVRSGILGMRIAGDLGPLTCYTTRRGKIVAFPISPPKEPASQKQTELRARFRAAQASWQELAPTERQALEECCRAAAAPLTGQNLWIHGAMVETDSLETLSRQTGIRIPIPPRV